MATAPSASFSVTLRLRLPAGPDQLDRIAAAIHEAGGEVVLAVPAEETALPEPLATVIANACSLRHAQAIVAAARELPDVIVEKVTDNTFALHDRGKLGQGGIAGMHHSQHLQGAENSVARGCMIREDKMP